MGIVVLVIVCFLLLHLVIKTLSDDGGSSNKPSEPQEVKRKKTREDWGPLGAYSDSNVDTSSSYRQFNAEYEDKKKRMQEENDQWHRDFMQREENYYYYYNKDDKP